MVSESSSSLATSHEVDAVSSLDESLGDKESSSILLQASVLVVDQQLLNRRPLQPIRELKNSRMSPCTLRTGNYSATLFMNSKIIRSKIILY